MASVEQQRQQQQKPSVQQPQTQMHPQSVSTQQVPQTQHAQFQAQLRYPQQLQQSSMPMSVSTSCPFSSKVFNFLSPHSLLDLMILQYQASGVTGHQNVQVLIGCFWI